jgi:predicted ATP-dependent serine protease
MENSTITQSKEWTKPIRRTSFAQGKQAEVVSLDNVKQTEIDWLWPGRVPMGMLTLIAGDPGVGKSFLTLYMAATVSAGQEWPDSVQRIAL